MFACWDEGVLRGFGVGVRGGDGIGAGDFVVTERS